MTIVLLSTDLMVVSRVEGAAAKSGQSHRAASNAIQAIDFCRAEPSGVLIVDLGMPTLDVNALVGELKAGAQAPPRIVAFGPHVHEERLAAARQAGCDEVVSRGQFFAQLDAILRR